jgi:hypothetical protein
VFPARTADDAYVAVFTHLGDGMLVSRDGVVAS